MAENSATNATPTRNVQLREAQTAMERIERLEGNVAQLAQMVATMAGDLHALMQLLERAQVVSRMEGPNDSRLN